MTKKSKSNTLKPFNEQEMLDKVSWKPDRIKLKMQKYLELKEWNTKMLTEHNFVGKLKDDLLEQKESIDYNIKQLKIMMSEVNAEAMRDLMLSDNQIDELGIPAVVNWEEKKKELIRKSTKNLKKELRAWYNRNNELQELGVNDDNIDEVIDELVAFYPSFWDKVGEKFGKMFDDRFRSIKANADAGYHKKSTKPKVKNPDIVERDEKIIEQYSKLEKQEIKPEAIRRRLAKEHKVKPSTIKSIVSG